MLIELLPHGEVFEIRDINGKLEAIVPYKDALAEAYAGAIEGVGSRAGKIRFLRRLRPEAMEPPILSLQEEAFKSKSTAVTKANIGVFREELRIQPPGAASLAEGAIIAHCWAFHLLHETRA